MIRASLWAVALFGLCIGWGFLMNAALYGAGPFAEDLPVALGLGGSVFLVSIIAPGIAYATTGSITKALWTWTIVILLALAFLGIGGARLSH